MAHLRQAFDGRNLPTSYTVSPGNEGGLDLVDFVEFLTTDKSTKAIVLYAEHIRRPAEFLVAAKAARARRQAGHPDASGPRRGGAEGSRSRTPVRSPATTR